MKEPYPEIRQIPPTVEEYELHGKDIEYSGSAAQLSNSDNEEGRAGDNELREPGGSIIEDERPSAIDYSKGLFVNSINAENINLKSGDQMRLVFRKWPVTLWIVGILVMGAAVYLFYHLVAAKNQKNPLFEGLEKG